jgi:hypothetical protein
MATIEIDDEKIHQLLRGDRGMEVLLEPTREPDTASGDDRTFEWRADRSGEDAPEEEASLNGNQAARSAPVPA